MDRESASRVAPMMCFRLSIKTHAHFYMKKVYTPAVLHPVTNKHHQCGSV